MAYEFTILESEDEYRMVFEGMYCDPLKPILTFDDIWVRFFPDMFDHAFFKSYSRHAQDKSLFCEERAKRISWIKETLEDPTAIFKVGWNKSNSSYDIDRRVAIVKENYVVVIQLFEKEKARFITAYIADSHGIEKIKKSPDWEKKIAAD